MPEGNSYSEEGLIQERVELNEQRIKVEQEFSSISERRSALSSYHTKLCGAIEMLTKLIGDGSSTPPVVDIPPEDDQDETG